MKKTAPTLPGKYNVSRFFLAMACLILAGQLLLAAEEDLVIRASGMAAAIDAQYQPIGPATVFPAGTRKVCFWFRWEHAAAERKLHARWTYYPLDLTISSSDLTLPRVNGSGGVCFSMPPGKTMPSGLYGVTLRDGPRVLAARLFRVN